jgi:hypothetical protein
MVPNTAHILQLTLSELWSRTYTMYLQLHIFRIQYSTERICAAIADISTIQCALYCKHGAKYSVQPPVYAIWTVVPDIYNLNTVPHIQASIFNYAYLRWYWRCVDSSMRLILLTLCQIQRISSKLRNVNCGPGHIHCNHSSTYSGFNIQQNVAPLLLKICRQFTAWYTTNLVPIQRVTSSLRNVNSGPGHIQCIYSSSNSGFIIQLNVCALLLWIYRQFNARFTGNVVPNTALILQVTLSGLWSRLQTV